MPAAGLGATVMRAMQTTRGRLALLLGVLAAIWLASSAVAHFALGEFDGYDDALWSGVVHLLDPSALQDDDDFDRRAIGLVQVVVGLVFLVGVLFTVVAEIVGSSMERLGQFDAPVRARDHLLFVGGVDYLPPIVAELARAATLPGAEPPGRIVVLAPPHERVRRQEVAAELRRNAGPFRVDLVIGDVSGPEGFDLASARSARAVVIFPASRMPILPEAADLEVVQSGVAMRAHLEDRRPGRRPLVFLLFRRGRDVDAAWELFPSDWDAIVGDRSVSAVLRLAVVRPRFSHALPVVGAPRDQGVFAVPAAGLAGSAFASLSGRFERGLPVGLLEADGRTAEVAFAPAPERTLEPDEHVVVVAPDAAAAGDVGGTAAPAKAVDPGPLEPLADRSRRLLVVGWNELAGSLLGEFAQAGDRIAVTVLAPQSVIAAAGVHAPAGIALDIRDGSQTDPATLRDVLDAARPDAIVVVATPTSADLRTADASAVVAVMQLRRLTTTRPVPLIAQVFNPVAAPFHGHEDARIHVISSLGMIARALSLLLLEPLSALAAERLLGEGSLDVIEFEPPGGAGPAPFASVYQGMLRRGAVPLGFAPANGEPRLNPGADALVRPGDTLLVARAQPADR